MATLTVSEIALSDLDGLDITALAAAATSGGDEFVNDGRTILLISNEDSGTPTITVTAQKTAVISSPLGSAVISNKAVTMSAGNTTKQYHLLGSFSSAYNDGNGKCQITYSAVTSLKVVAIRIINV